MQSHPFPAYCIEDFRQLAARRLPRMVFDFFDGAAGAETTLRANRSALDGIGLIGNGPIDVEKRSMELKLFGQDLSMPVIIGPTGLAGAGWPKADVHLARAASAAGIPFVMSTAATATMDEVSKAGKGSQWFQLYLFRDRAISERMMARAQASGFSALELTVDCALAGRRLRDSHNGFTLPMRWNLRTALDVARRPSWALRMIQAGKPTLAAMAQEFGVEAQRTQTIAELMQQQLDPSVTWRDVEWVRRRWTGPMIVKGLMHPSQGKRALDCGADGIVVSNHGGRQLDGAVPSIQILPEFVSQIGGKIPILVDSGFRSGADIARALALGATAVQLGRATLYAVSVGGAVAARQALDILRAELDVTMGLMGLTSLAGFHRSALRELVAASGPISPRPVHHA